jgi:hypothetical protein
MLAQLHGIAVEFVNSEADPVRQPATPSLPKSIAKSVATEDSRAASSRSVVLAM